MNSRTLMILGGVVLAAIIITNIFTGDKNVLSEPTRLFAGIAWCFSERANKLPEVFHALSVKIIYALSRFSAIFAFLPRRSRKK